MRFDWFSLMIYWRTDVQMTSSLKLFLILYYIKQIDSKLPCVCSIIDHRGRPNVVSTSVPVREQCNSTFTNPEFCLTISETSVIFSANCPATFHVTIFGHLSLQHTLTLIFSFQTQFQFSLLSWYWRKMAREAHFKRTRIPLSVFHCKSILFIQKLSSPL